jgi:hypothetical protein
LAKTIQGHTIAAQPFIYGAELIQGITEQFALHGKIVH